MTDMSGTGISSYASVADDVSTFTWALSECVHCLQTPPALALENPQGSNSAAVEAQLEALIEARTGKAAALPILDEVPQVIAEGCCCELHLHKIAGLLLCCAWAERFWRKSVLLAVGYQQQQCLRASVGQQ